MEGVPTTRHAIPQICSHNLLYSIINCRTAAGATSTARRWSVRGPMATGSTGSTTPGGGPGGCGKEVPAAVPWANVEGRQKGGQGKGKSKGKQGAEWSQLQG